MSYEVINQELGVYSCSIADLTLEQIKQFIELWDNDGSSIGSLTIFYDDSGRIVINKDHKQFETFMKMVIDYIQLSEEEKEEMKITSKSKTFKSIFTIIDNALIYRQKQAESKALAEKWELIKKMLGKQCYPETKLVTELREQFFDGESAYIAIANIYNYAFIQGKRAERARRKKVMPYENNIK